MSFDVVSLFTQIPTDATIEIILKEAYKNPRLTRFHGLKRPDLKRLLEICTKESLFLFNGEFYDQVDGVSMDSPLGPLMANAFMCDLETKVMNELKKLGVVKWLRYVDDIFAIVDNEQQVEKILSFLNSIDHNIKFTVEHEKNASLPFLDTRVNVTNSGLVTTLYHKPTFTGVYLNWTSLTSKKYKLGLIYCLLDRAWKICAEEKLREEEFEKIRVMLRKNEYPDRIINQQFEKFIQSRANTEQQNNLDKSERDQKRFIALPYVCEKVEDFGKRLKKVVEKFHPKVDLTVAFQAPSTIGNLFPFKDRLKDREKQSLVVYKLQCKTCDAQYIGKTERILLYRLNEHRTHKHSPINQHLRTNQGHEFDFCDVKIIDRADTNQKLLIKEELHIRKNKPVLNTQLNCDTQFKSQIQTLLIL